MSAYEDVSLSYIDIPESAYAKAALSSPIQTTETFYLAVKFQATGDSVDGFPKVLTLGSSSGSGGISISVSQNDGRVTINHWKTAGTTQAHITGVSAAPKLLDGESHIVIVKVPPAGQPMQAWADLITKTVTTAALPASFNSQILGMALNGRANAIWSDAPVETGKWRIHWTAIYSNLSNSDIEAIFNGSNPFSIGTLRAGGGCFALDGSVDEVNNGPQLVTTGSTSFVQPVYPDTLAASDSYLAFTPAQYAQAQIGASRLATLGKDALVGTLPTWTPSTSFTISFKFYVKSAPTSGVATLMSATGGASTGFWVYQGTNTNDKITIRFKRAGVDTWVATTTNLIINAVNELSIIVSGGNISAILNGLSTGNLGAIDPINLSTIYQRDTYGPLTGGYIIDLALTDNLNASNSRFYPLNGDGSSNVIASQSGLNNGTWTNRLLSDVITAYPDAVKPVQEIWFAFKYRVTDVSQNSGFNNPMSLGRRTAGNFSNISIYTPETNHQFGVDPYNGTTRTSSSGFFGKDMGPTHLDGLNHTAVVRRKTDGSYEFWTDDPNIKYTGVPSSQMLYSMDVINLNGYANATNSAGRMGIRYHWFYLYNTLSAADIVALMQGEHPASVGNVKQGYDLNGSGVERNGGPALTLFNAPTFKPVKTTGLVTQTLHPMLQPSLGRLVVQ